MNQTPPRHRLITTPYIKGTVVYNMCRELRADDNDALLFAQELALSRNEKLIVNYVVYNYLWVGATRRLYDWVLPSLVEVEKTLRKHNIPLVITLESRNLFDTHDRTDIPPHIGAVVMEQIPLRFARQWNRLFLKNHPDVPLYEVDAHNCVPVWELSTKQEFAAHTMRSKLHKVLAGWLTDFSQLKHHTPNESILDELPPIDWVKLQSDIVCDESVEGTGTFTPGSYAASLTLHTFLTEKLEHYEEDRNDFTVDGSSNLSPYLAHGNIARRRVLMETLTRTSSQIDTVLDKHANGSNGSRGSVAAFVEELVVRAELAENFCYYNENYATSVGFPTWAKSTLTAHEIDERAYIYSYAEFAQAKTHDNLWNAAQLHLVNTGKMHGYLRMYWAKKILEWSPNAEDAMEIAVKLNDIYELDGRDPNGYAGCAWSIGGLHDRAWFNRPIFGLVRYMAESGAKKNGDIQKYIARHQPENTLLL